MSNYDRGQYLKKLLKKRNMTQTELGKQIDISRQTIGKHIKYDSFFGIDKYMKISKVLDISLDDLIYGGRKRTTKLKAFAMKPINEIDINKLPKQPDGLGNYLIDYIIELDYLDKFYFFLEEDVYIIPIHTHIGVLGFLIKHGQHEFIKKQFKYTIIDVNKNKKQKLNHKFEFPILDYMHKADYNLEQRNNHQYIDLNQQHKEFVDILLNTKSEEILDLIPYKRKEGVNEFPSIWHWSVERDKVFIVDYYIGKYNSIVKQEYFDHAIFNKSWLVSKYFIENYKNIRTMTNLSKFKETRYRSKMEKEWGFI